MFTPIVAQLGAQFKHELASFLTYLQRHIELDGDTHGILAQQLTDHLCEGDPQKCLHAQAAVKEALLSRLRLWDCAYEQIQHG